MTATPEMIEVGMFIYDAPRVAKVEKSWKAHKVEQIYSFMRDADPEWVSMREALIANRRALASAMRLLDDCEISRPLRWHDALDSADAILTQAGGPSASVRGGSHSNDEGLTALANDVRLVLEDAAWLERTADEADDNGWLDLAAGMRGTAERIRICAAALKARAKLGQSIP